MREDMSDVIVERPRRGMRNSSRQAAWEKNACLEDLPTKEGVRRRHAAIGSQRELNENLAPLKRYLQGQVGRPWNLVYRDICANITPRSAVQLHVRQHVWDFVERHVVVADDGIHGSPTAFAGRGHRLRAGELYIDPVNGLLRRVRARRK